MTWFLRLAGRRTASHRARLLGLDLFSDLSLPDLDSAPAPEVPFLIATAFSPRAGRCVFDREVFLAGGPSRLAVWWQGERAWLEAGPVVIGVDLAAGRIELLTPLAPGSDSWLEHVLLGPPLLLALARSGIFGLHAGAVRVDDGLVVFLGASGAGKSTLARSAGEHWQGFADDLLPVTIATDDPPRGLGGFPQLKLAPERRRVGAGEALPLRAVVLLAGSGESPVARRLAPAEAAAAWIAHTMIARLFSPRLLADHLAWAVAGAAAVPTWEVRFPWGLERLEEVRRWLVERLCYPPPR